MANKKRGGKRFGGGKPRGMTLAQYIARESAYASMMANRDAIIYHANLMTQRALWMTVVAIHDAFGYGRRNIGKYLSQLEIVQDEYVQLCEEGDEEYADEKLRARAAQLSGLEIDYFEKCVNAIEKITLRLNEKEKTDE